MEEIKYTEAKQTPRGTRVWLEGKTLEAVGFLPNTYFDVSWSIPKQTIQLDHAGYSDPQCTVPYGGDRKVSSRKRKGSDARMPIIDLQSANITEIFPPGTRIKVTLAQGKILFEKHHEEVAKESRAKKFLSHTEQGCLKEASLFTGGGISTEAIHQAIHDTGVESHVVYIAEMEGRYIESARTNCFAITDATTILSGTVEEIESRHYTDCDILSFSMPCAGFSKAGAVKHKQTPEQHSGTTLFGVVRAIQSSNPAVIISENVTEAMGSPIYTLLKAELTRLGYKTYEQILDASHTGTFERRPRYWLVAVDETLAASLHSEHFALPVQNANVEGERQIHLRDLLSAEIDESMWSENQYLKDKSVRDAAAGKGFAKRQLLTGDETHCGVIGRHYNKRRSTEPFIIRPDVDTKERLLTPDEHARVKSIPERLVAGIPTTTAHEILGQSVDFLQPYLLVKRLFEALYEHHKRNIPIRPRVSATC